MKFPGTQGAQECVEEISLANHIQKKPSDKRHLLVRFGLGLLGLILVFALVYFITNRIDNRHKIETTSFSAESSEISSTGNQSDSTVPLRRRSGLTSILVIGVDLSEEREQTASGVRSGGQADYLSLLVIDHPQEKIYWLDIDRDTITDIPVLSALGRPKGTRKAQIALSHGYGTNRKDSAKLTRQAVRNLLQGEYIDAFVSISMDGIRVMNRLAGGVTVTIPDDLTAVSPVFQKDAVLTLTDEQAELFVRSRKNVGLGLNRDRMQRQGIYLNAFLQQVGGKLRDDPSYINTLLDELSDSLVSDMSRGRILNEAKRTSSITTPVEKLTVTGKQEVDEQNHMAFYPDEQSITRLVRTLFYKEQPQANGTKSP